MTKLLCILPFVMLASCANMKVLETIPPIPAPEWVGQSVSRWEKNGRIFFKTLGEGYPTLTDAQEASSAMAKKQILEEISSSIMSLETINNQSMRFGENGSYASNGKKENYSFNENVDFSDYSSLIVSAIDTIQARGITINEMYIQHIAQKTGRGTEVFYRAYVLASISRKNYAEIGNSVFEKAVKSDGKSKKMLKELQDKWNNTLTEEE